MKAKAEESALSRRAVLKGAAMGSGALAASALLG